MEVQVWAIMNYGAIYTTFILFSLLYLFKEPVVVFNLYYLLRHEFQTLTNIGYQYHEEL